MFSSILKYIVMGCKIMNLLPKVKRLDIKENKFSKKYISSYEGPEDSRIKKAVEKLQIKYNSANAEQKDGGAKLVINAKEGKSEKYTLEITEDCITINAEGLNGAFYGVQTLRQIFTHETVPCLYIEDESDFEYRGLYHDITRGKVPKVSTLKKLIDDMAYFKMNSLQLYVEHTFEFEETKDIAERTGYITKEEIKELDEYCTENFIEFIPSIATFGHMYEILEQDKYKHLRVLKDHKTAHNFWTARMEHHTIDPFMDESFEVVKSLVDQYYPLFKTDKFNICGDETFDLGEGNGDIYIDFMTKIINYLSSKGKKIMMWADILLKHPETLSLLPDDVCCLNWNYHDEPNEENIKKLAQLGKEQILCPGTTTWSRFCERVDIEEPNITKMADYGKKYGAKGILNTNWGDYANPASIELAMYGIVLGAAKSWAVDTVLDENFYASIDDILYGASGAFGYLKRLSDAHNIAFGDWNDFCRKYFELRFGEKQTREFDITPEQISETQEKCTGIINELSSQKWKFDEARKEMILCAEGLCVLAQLGGKMLGIECETVVEPKKWLESYGKKWLEKNKKSELFEIEKMITYLAEK